MTIAILVVFGSYRNELRIHVLIIGIEFVVNLLLDMAELSIICASAIFGANLFWIMLPTPYCLN